MVRSVLSEYTILVTRHQQNKHVSSAGHCRYEIELEEARLVDAAFASLRDHQSAGNWLVRRWKPQDERRNREFVPSRGMKRESFSTINFATLNVNGWKKHSADIMPFLARQRTDVFAAQEVYGPGTTPSLTTTMGVDIKGYNVFNSPYTSQPGSHGVFLAVAKKWTAWEFAPATTTVVAVQIDMGSTALLMIGMYVPTSSVINRHARRETLDFARDTAQAFIQQHPLGKVVLLGDLNMPVKRVHNCKQWKDAGLTRLEAFHTLGTADAKLYSASATYIHTDKTSTIDHVLYRHDQLGDKVKVEIHDTLHDLAVTHLPLVGSLTNEGGGKVLQDRADSWQQSRPNRCIRQKLREPGVQGTINAFPFRALHNNRFASLLPCGEKGDETNATSGMPVADTEGSNDPDTLGTEAGTDEDPFWGKTWTGSSTTENTRAEVDTLVTDFMDDLTKCLKETGVLVPPGKGNKDGMCYSTRAYKRAVSVRRETWIEWRQSVLSLGPDHTKSLRLQRALDNIVASCRSIKALQSKRGWRKRVIAASKAFHSGKSKETWQHVHSSTGKGRGASSSLPVKNKDGMLQTTPKNILDTWAKHFSALAADADGKSRSFEWLSETSASVCIPVGSKVRVSVSTHADDTAGFVAVTKSRVVRGHVYLRKLDVNDLETGPILAVRPEQIALVPSPQTALTYLDLVNFLRKSDNGKAAGLSGLPVELWKMGIPTAKEVQKTLADGKEVDPSGAFQRSLFMVAKAMAKHGHIPASLNRSLICAVYKKGPKSDCGNYRGIALIETLVKTVTGALTLKNQTRMEDNGNFTTEQGGFRSHEECVSQYLSLWEVCSRRRASGQQTFLFFADLRKAFDTCGHSAILHKLRVAGASDELVAFIRAIYEQSQIAVRLPTGVSAFEDFLRGVRQGCPASPHLFINFINDFFDLLREEETGVTIPGVPHLDEVVENNDNDAQAPELNTPVTLTIEDISNGVLDAFVGLLFADDSVAVASTPYVLTRVILLMVRFTRTWGMAFGVSKCAVVIVPPVGENGDDFYIQPNGFPKGWTRGNDYSQQTPVCVATAAEGAPAYLLVEGSEGDSEADVDDPTSPSSLPAGVPSGISGQHVHTPKPAAKRTLSFDPTVTPDPAAINGRQNAMRPLMKSPNFSPFSIPMNSNSPVPGSQSSLPRTIWPSGVKNKTTQIHRVREVSSDGKGDPCQQALRDRNADPNWSPWGWEGPRPKIDGDLVPFAYTYEYLGLSFWADLDLAKIVIDRAAKVRKARKACSRYIGSAKIPVGLRKACYVAKIESVATYGAETFGMCTAFKSRAAKILRPITKELDCALFQITKGSWDDITHPPMGTCSASVRRSLGLAPFVATVDKLRTRSCIKSPTMSTWLARLSKHRFQQDRDAEALPSRSLTNRASASWFDSYLQLVIQLQKWIKSNGQSISEEDHLEMSKASQQLVGDVDSIENARGMKDRCRAVRRVRSAKFWSSISSKAHAKLHHFKFHETAADLSWFSIRYPELALGVHWIHRMRTGAFMLFGTAKKRGLLDEALIGNRICASCKARTDHDSIPHFLFRCSGLKAHRKLAQGEPTSKPAITFLNTCKTFFDSMPMSFADIEFAANDMHRFGLGPSKYASEAATAILTMGGTHNGCTCNSITNKQLHQNDSLTASLDAICDQQQLADWRSFKPFDGSHAGFLLLASYLQAAMPSRNQHLWDQFAATSLRQRHSSIRLGGDS